MAKDTHFQVHEETELLPFLIAKFPGRGRNKVKGLLTHRQVMVDDQIVTRHDHPLAKGNTVRILATGSDVKESMQGIRILYEDSELLVIDKPPGLLSMATEEERERTAYRVLTDYVRRSNPQGRVFIVHRLDKETSGVMMFAKTEAVKDSLQDSWKDSVVERSYVVVVEGTLTQETGTIKTWMKESKTRTMYVSKPGDGLKAVTHYQVLQAANGFSLLEVRLETGRKNQIRVHMQHIGHSVVGDKKYGSTKNPIGRLGLHARVLSFRHPSTKQLLRFETAIPASFKQAFSAKKH